MSYQIPSKAQFTFLEVKKSKFYTLAAYAENRESAMRWLQDMRLKYPDAGHHCWAYLLGDPQMPQSVAMSDDGEPSGTAGKPILNVLQHNGIGDIVIVVSRYFGGIKLGTGGLVRAYSNAAQQSIETLSTHPLVAKSLIKVCADFKHEQYVRHWLERHDVQIIDYDYKERVILKVNLPTITLAQFENMCAKFTIQYSLD